ncbi:MAG: heavy metal translocating P-type ATPase, partial [Candidatus Aenigmarchaeota archaeon]|nr:heavy metal translocating P-type ATPase [Candidatus Aenigmarchaeota archaeon]
PVDGTIISGSSCIDESMITGESIGVEKKEGDRVIAGTIAVDGLIKVKVESVGEDTYLSHIVELIENVEKSKTRNKRLMKRTYRLFMIVIILSFASTFVIWKLIGISTYLSFRRAATVLIISSNASLVLATPIALIFSITTLTKSGIVIRNPRSVETLPVINTYVFDKTGTLTEGKTEVKEITTINGSNIEEVVNYFLIAEKHSSHPIAKMTCKELKGAGRIPEPDHFKEYFGMGVYARYKNKKIHVGGEKFLDLFNIEKNNLDSLKNQLIVCVDRKPIGMIRIEDTLKRSSKELIQFLKEKNKEIIILTGDKRKNSEKIGEELGVEKIFSEITPEKKLEIIKNLRKKGPLVMIGDGINDAPSLAQADIGISVNNELDLIRESSDIVLIRNDLRLVEKLIRISEFTKTKIKQNLFWTYFYNIIAVLMASGALVGLGLNVNPLLASAASISSTVSIMINSFLFR